MSIPKLNLRGLMLCIVIALALGLKAQNSITPEEQQTINAQALEAAKKLSISDALEKLHDDSWTNYGVNEWNAFELKHFQDVDFRHQSSASKSAMDTLHMLCQERHVTEPKIIPYLIDALDSPNMGIRHDAAYALDCLLLHFGSKLLHETRENREARLQGIACLKKWWKENETNNPIIDLRVEVKSRTEVFRLSKIIEEKVKPHFPDLYYFHTPTSLRLDWANPLFQIEYSLRSLLLSGAARPPNFPRYDQLPWIYITCRMPIPEFDKMFNPTGYTLNGPKEKLTTIFKEQLEGTCIVINVDVATPNKDLLESLKTAFNSETNALPKK